MSFPPADNDQRCRVDNASGIANADVTTVELLCSPLTSELRFADAAPKGHLSTGDYNGHGALDLALVMNTFPEHSSESGKTILRIMPGDGAGGFFQGGDYALERLNYTSFSPVLATTDLNGEDFDDIVTYDYGELMRYSGGVNGLTRHAGRPDQSRRCVQSCGDSRPHLCRY